MRRIIAVFIVIGAAFIAAVASSMAVPVNVTANPAVCTIDGTCDQIENKTCQITAGGTAIVFYVVSGGGNCGTVVAKGNFSQP